MDLDLLSFNALFESVVRMHYSELQEQAWATHIASQGSTKDLKKHLKQYDKVVKSAKAPGGDLNDFLSQVKGGI